VIIDVCKKHGIWFDRDELSKIIEFIRDGGLDMARAREKIQLEEERRHLEQMKRESPRSEVSDFFETEHRMTGIASASGLLKFLLR
jgi:Zn-finger nucleic acid-binding protein